jgi:diguanylate cyclase (GGDEF)-like protein
MEHPLRLLIVDDHQPDAELSALQIARGGFPCTWRRVETEAEFRTGLREFSPDLILSDFSLPRYNGLAALELAVSEAPSVPFIFVSGTIGEKRAAEALTRGAADYISKNDRRRLVLAVVRVLGEGRPPANEGATSVHRLVGGLQMLSGLRAAVASVHTATALLEEACRVVYATNQYEYAFIALMDPHEHTAHTVAWTGAGAGRGRNARFQVATVELADTSVIGRVLRTGEPILCLDVGQYTGPLCEQERGAAPRESAFVSLPLLVGNTSIGALTVGTATHTYISEPELLLLEELVRQVSLALQALPAEGTARHLSPLDPLTLLSKREFFREHLQHRLDQMCAQGITPTVIAFDIERLRDVNNTHGRHVGDRLLQAVAERLTCRFGSSADLAHFGSGRFVAVFDERRCPSDRAYDTGTTVLGQSFMIGDLAVPVSVKCGTACYPDHGRDAETLLQHAEVALGKVRDGSELPLQPPLRADAMDSRQRGLEQRLRLALKEEQFLIHYQPVIERLSGRIIAVEALLRWRDPERGLISPGAFLPALEHTGLIVSVGEWVLSRVVRDSARWHTLGLPKIRVAVNISTTELNRRDFARFFLDTVRLARPSPGIDIEIPESALLEDREDRREILKTLRAAGVRVAIDDFGMVHPSLTRLVRSPVDSLKIDRSLINQLSGQPQSQAVVSCIIAVAKACSLHTVAEGVETMEQLEIVDALGCEQSQGYLHSPAVPVEQLQLLLGACSSGGVSREDFSPSMLRSVSRG